MTIWKEFAAPAKINLCLYVLGRFSNGYHKLAMAMQRISLADEIRIGIDGQGSGVEVSCVGLDLARDEENIVAKAARAFLAEAGLDVAVHITLAKKIPVAAGLGGGSSDAATVLMGLNELTNAGLSQEQLLEIGAQLGADVPFFIFKRPAWATGTGVDLAPLAAVADVAYVLVNPGIAVSTAEVYKSLQLTKGGVMANLPRFSAATCSELCCALHNDLESVVIPRYPVVAQMKEALLAAGAVGALMSGSGATVYGVFPSFAAAENASVALREDSGWFVCPVKPLA